MQDQMHAARSAISRACGPSIGTICKAALIQAVVGTFLYLLRGLRRVRGFIFNRYRFSNRLVVR